MAGMKRPRRSNPLVKLTVVPFGDDQWGVAGTLDGARTFINYIVGDKEAAVAEADRLEEAARDYKPDDT
jgi:hypothetical protein